MNPEELEAQRLAALANTQVTDPPPVPPTPEPTPINNNPLNALYEQAYLEQVRKTQELEARLNQPATPVNTPSTNNGNDEYWNNPADFIRSTIQKELRDTIKPFQQNLEIDSRQRKYQEAKALIRNAIPYFNQIESEVDAVVTQGNLDPTPQNLQLAISIVLGARQMQNRPLSLDSTPTPVPANNMIPPNLPPSAPPPPVPHPVNQTPPLTELERRIARERNMTDDEYVYYRDAPTNITSIKSFQESKAGAK